jgi:hypothetical protein
LVFSVPVINPATRPFGAIIEMPLPIFDAVLAFSELSTQIARGSCAVDGHRLSCCRLFPFLAPNQ